MRDQIRVVFDTNSVVSALLFKGRQLSWLRSHWKQSTVISLVSTATVSEIIRVLSYRKFNLNQQEIEALLAEYLPYTESIAGQTIVDAPQCSDQDDQMFIDLAISGEAGILVTGDKALLDTKVEFRIMKPADYKIFIVRSEKNQSLLK